LLDEVPAVFGQDLQPGLGRVARGDGWQIVAGAQGLSDHHSIGVGRHPRTVPSPGQAPRSSQNARTSIGAPMIAEVFAAHPTAASRSSASTM
jgi:hypothetical protein